MVDLENSDIVNTTSAYRTDGAKVSCRQVRILWSKNSGKNSCWISGIVTMDGTWGTRSGSMTNSGQNSRSYRSRFNSSRIVAAAVSCLTPITLAPTANSWTCSTSEVCAKTVHDELV